MELHSILLLLMILSIIGYLTFFINNKQKKQLKKVNHKQEPRFDLITNHLPSAEYDYLESEIGVMESDSHDDNMLLDDPLLQPRTVTPNSKNQEQEPVKKNKSSIEEIIYLFLSANNNKPYVGYELLQALLAAGLRFGPMDIFHRHEDVNGQGKIIFSVAAANEPGTFEINKIGAFSGKGLVMFLRLSSNRDLMSAFELMLETAKQLVEDLDGDILDDERKVLTPEKVEKLRKKILEFEQKQLIGDLFDE